MSRAAFAQLTAEVADLRREVAELRALVAPPMSEADLALLRMLRVVTVEGAAWRACDIVEAAEESDELDAALIGALVPPGRWRARRLGKALQRLQGCDVGPYRLVRVGEARDGARWTLEAVRE